MRVYPKITVYCPQSKKEQDGNKCLICENYSGIKKDEKQLVIKCDFHKIFP